MSMRLKTPRRRPRLGIVALAPRPTRVLLSQDPTTRLSKTEATRLADRGAALGHGTQTANQPRGVRVPNDSFWGRVRMGEVQRSRRARCCLAANSLPVRTNQEPKVWKKRIGDVELSHFQLPVRYDAHGSGPLSERMFERLFPFPGP